MKNAFFSSLCLFCLAIPASGDKNPALRRYYFSLGYSPIDNISYPQAKRFLLHDLPDPLTFGFALETRKYNLIGLRLYSSQFYKATQTVEGNQCTDCGYYRGELALMLGKTINAGRMFSLSLSSGPSFVSYTIPENVRYSGSQSYFHSYYDYDLKTYRIPGWSGRVDVNFNPWYAGASLGFFYNYNSRQSLMGMNLNLMFGKLKVQK